MLLPWTKISASLPSNLICPLAVVVAAVFQVYPDPAPPPPIVIGVDTVPPPTLALAGARHSTGKRVARTDRHPLNTGSE